MQKDVVICMSIMFKCYYKCHFKQDDVNEFSVLKKVDLQTKIRALMGVPERMKFINIDEKCKPAYVCIDCNTFDWMTAR